MGTTLLLIFRCLATKFSNRVQKKKPPGPVSWNFGDPMKLRTPGPQFHNHFGDPFVKLGTPLWTRMRIPRNYILNCLQSTQLLSKVLSGHSELTAYKQDCLHQSAHSTVSFRWLLRRLHGSIADVDACSDNELVNVGITRMKRLRFTCS